MLFLIGFNHLSLAHNNCSNCQGIINSVLKTSKPSQRSLSIASHRRSSFESSQDSSHSLGTSLVCWRAPKRFVIFFFIRFYNHHHPNSQNESLWSHPHLPMKLKRFLSKTLSYWQYLVLACHWTLTQKWYPHLALKIKGQRHTNHIFWLKENLESLLFFFSVL